MHPSTLLLALSCSLPGALSGPIPQLKGISPVSSRGISFDITKLVSKAGAPDAKDVEKAANEFAGNVNKVSEALDQLRTTTDPTKIKQLVTEANDAEAEEGKHRELLFTAAGEAGKAANTQITTNAPAVVAALDNIGKDTKQANVQEQLRTIEALRNEKIIPGITSLFQAAYAAAKVSGKPPTLNPTNGAAGGKKPPK